MGGVNKAFPVLPLVEIVRLEVTAVLPGVTESVLKLHAAFKGFPPQERVTALLNAALTDETVTVMVAVVCPPVTEMVVGETATEKSAGAAPTLVTNPSAGRPPNKDCAAEGDLGNPKPVGRSAGPAEEHFRGS